MEGGNKRDCPQEKMVCVCVCVCDGLSVVLGTIHHSLCSPFSPPPPAILSPSPPAILSPSPPAVLSPPPSAIPSSPPPVIPSIVTGQSGCVHVCDGLCNGGETFPYMVRS